jgi:hypothetical protein
MMIRGQGRRYAHVPTITSQGIVRRAHCLYNDAAEYSAQRSNQESSMSNVNEMVVSYLAAWNERDARRRRELVEQTWTERGLYVDAHRRGEGHDAIDALLKTAQDQFPGYRLRLVSGIETHNGYVRFSWAAGGAPDAPLYLAGTDFAILASDGRIQSVSGFVDAAPARAV